MMRRYLTVMIVSAFVGVYGVQAGDGERGTAKEAQTMVELGILVFENEGAAGAFAEINAGPPAFRKRDLYLFVVDMDGLVVANSLHPDYVGRDVLDIKDANDTPIVHQMIDRATKRGVWVDYLFEDPLTGEVEPKSSWVVRHDNYIFVCGIYSP